MVDHPGPRGFQLELPEGSLQRALELLQKFTEQFTRGAGDSSFSVTSAGDRPHAAIYDALVALGVRAKQFHITYELMLPRLSDLAKLPAYCEKSDDTMEWDVGVGRPSVFKGAPTSFTVSIDKKGCELSFSSADLQERPDNEEFAEFMRELSARIGIETPQFPLKKA